MKYFTNWEDPGTVGCLDGVGPLDAPKEIFSQGSNLPVVISFSHKIEKRNNDVYKRIIMVMISQKNRRGVEVFEVREGLMEYLC